MQLSPLLSSKQYWPPLRVSTQVDPFGQSLSLVHAREQ
jgi:hypothetical protein